MKDQKKEMRHQMNQTEQNLMIEIRQHTPSFSGLSPLCASSQQDGPTNKDLMTAIEHQKHLLQQIMGGQVKEMTSCNKQLTKTLAKSEKRCQEIEKKNDKLLKYEHMVKNCQRLQCRDCNRLYTPLLFINHYLSCRRQARQSVQLPNKTISKHN